MHKNVMVAEVEIDDVTSGISTIHETYRADHLPVSVRPDDAHALNGWWTGRAIPASRAGIRDVLEALHIPSTSSLLLKGFGLSLSDHYWMNPADHPLKWSEVNFFDNDFSEDVGTALFGGAPEGRAFDLKSPDNTSDGWLKKKWIIADEKRMLLKGGSAPYYLEPFNEVLASSLFKRLNVPHTAYSIVWDRQLPLSVCEDFITRETELVNAGAIFASVPMTGAMSKYEHFIACCTKLKIPDAAMRLDQMLAVDYIMANTDRHFNNFGAVRHAESLTYLNPAPIFDSGTSMWNNVVPQRIRAQDEVDCKPFLHVHSLQIELIASFDWLDFDCLQGIEDEYEELLKGNPFVDEQHRAILCRALKTRVGMLRNITQSPRQGEALNLKF